MPAKLHARDPAPEQMQLNDAESLQTLTDLQKEYDAIASNYDRAKAKAKLLGKELEDKAEEIHAFLRGDHRLPMFGGGTSEADEEGGE